MAAFGRLFLFKKGVTMLSMGFALETTMATALSLEQSASQSFCPYTEKLLKTKKTITRHIRKFESDISVEYRSVMDLVICECYPNKVFKTQCAAYYANEKISLKFGALHPPQDWAIVDFVLLRALTRLDKAPSSLITLSRVRDLCRNEVRFIKKNLKNSSWIRNFEKFSRTHYAISKDDKWDQFHLERKSLWKF